MKLSVVAVGDANVDLIAPIASLPGKGGEVWIQRLERHAGGSAANLSVAISRLGLSSGFIGRVGDDPFGHFLIDEFKKERVDIGQLQIDKEVGTGLMFIAITEEGERTMYGFRGANVNLSAGEIDVGYVKNVDVLHISGYTFLSEAQRKAALELLEAARAAGVFVSLDVGVLTAMEAADRVRSILRSIDLLFLNELEAERLARIEDPEKAAESILESGVRTVALKRGSRGCFILNREQRVRSPAFRVNVVDTTGGGDAFAAGFLVGIIEGRGLEEAARFANAVGALAVTKAGARSALPVRQEVEEFLKTAKI